jgi:hypothetical protein
VRAARYGEQPPPELSAYWLCKRFGGLPEAGGVLDQDAGMVNRMTACANAYDVIAHLISLQGEQIHSLTEGERMTIKWLMEIEVFNG